VRLWSVHTGANKLVNYPDIINRSMGTPTSIAVSSDGTLLYHPNGLDIGVYEVKTGDLVVQLKQHLNRVKCCCFHPSLHELYSGGLDGQINLWSPQPTEQEDLNDANNEPDNDNRPAADDDWSDSADG